MDRSNLSRASGTAALDRRGNNAAATVRESRFAQQTWANMPEAHKREMVGELRWLIQSSKNFQAVFSRFSRSMPRADRHYVEDRFHVAHTLERRLDHWEENDGTSKGLCNLLLGGDAEFKDLTDCIGTCAEHLEPDTAETARGRSYFQDRGRMSVPGAQQRAESVLSRHSGITDSVHRTPSMENFFSGDVEHYKGMARRDEQSMTAQRFQRSGTPFIGGASGTMANLLMLMELKAPQNTLEDPEYDQRERALGHYASLLVAGGHHSMMECILPARSYGYFLDVPNPLNEGGDYNRSASALEASLANIGIRPGVPLGA
jgi:hypothetical protein